MLQYLWIGAVLLSLPAAASAQSPLTLREAIDLALERHPSVQASSAGVAAAAARVREARASWLPRVDVVEGWQRGNQPVFVFGSLLSQQRFAEANFAIDTLNRPDAVTNHHAAVIVEQTVFDGWRTAASVTAARLSRQIAEQDTRRARLDVVRETIAAFGRALSAAAHASAARSAVESAQEDSRRAEARRAAGIESEATVLAFRVELSNAELRRAQAEGASSDARAALNTIVGVPLDDRRPLAPLPPLARDAADSAALQTVALENRPESIQARLRVQAAEQQRRAARAGFFPHVAVQAALDANGHTFGDRATTWTAGVQLRWNLFAGGADLARTQAAVATAEAARAEQRQIADDIRLQVQQALNAHATAVVRRDTARTMVDHAAESRRIIRERYAAGLAPAVDLLRAAETVSRAQAVEADAVADVHITAAAIDRATGRFETQK